MSGRFTGPLPLGEPVEWRCDTARFTLRSGRVWLLEPTAAGVVTGLVFEGDGRFELRVPDPVERRQLPRFARDPEVDRLDETFDQLVLRGSDLVALLPESLLAAPAGASHQEHPLAAERHRTWRRDHFEDVDARVIAALRDSGAHYRRADLRTGRFGWLSWTWDDLRAEEIEVARLDPSERYRESWLSLDRGEDRRDDGRPGETDTESLRLIAVDARVDVTAPDRGATRGVGAVNPVDALFETVVRVKALRDGQGALVLELHPLAEVERVWEVPSGGELPALRFNLGRTDSSLPNRLHHSTLVVPLERELSHEQEIELGVAYKLELPGFASALSWYPRPLGMGLDLHDVRLEVTHRRDYGVAAVGEQVERREKGGHLVSVWQTAGPIDAGAFTIARAPHQRSFRHEGLPELVMFGTQAGYLSAEKIDSFAPDIINSIHYFQNLFASPVRTERTIVSFIASGHGQAMEGFLHVSDSIAQALQEGRAGGGFREWFLAHEVAHEWWGHQVGWASYRDQWLSEGFASYAAMMFVEASLDNGPRLFRQILESYTNELNGSIGGAFGAFARPGMALLNRAGRDRMGPIGLGLRSGVAESPAAYQSMAYTKGAMVLHMLRSILRAATRSDETFLAILRDFVATWRGRRASTADFQAVLTKHAPSDWSWFFDQWVEGTSIPTYRSKSEIVKAEGGGFLVRLTVEQSDVPPGFRSPVPVRIELPDGRVAEQLLLIDEPRETFELEVPARPRKVELNPEFAILARMR
ncbi:MAG TPA: M1 family aminopeptidase [Thermoanaerobaculia bacterium]|nr:M1 family aminopeptidase [Thermoanaerobaculia bacterium]